MTAKIDWPVFPDSLLGEIRVTTKAYRWPIFVAHCDVGRGVFASSDVQPGDVVLRFTGPRITLAEALAKGPLHCNPLQVADAWYIDLDEPGVLVNHSCDPNAGIVDDGVLVALRPIRKGEEVRFDYSTSMADGTWEMACRCGSATCRNVVQDFEFLPSAVRTRYLDQGVVQRFIVRQAAGPASGVRPAGSWKRCSSKVTQTEGDDHEQLEIEVDVGSEWT